MSTSFDQTFIDLFGSEIHAAYQRKGSKLRGLCHNVSGVGGDTYRFPKLGSAVANQKARNSNVVAMDAAHDFVTATLADWYAPEYTDKLDEMKTNISIRAGYVNNAMWALGRRTDQIIIDAWSLTPDEIVTSGGSAGLSEANVNAHREHFDNLDVDYEGRFAVISPIGLSQLIELTNGEFIDADLRGSFGPETYNTGKPVGKWLGFNWLVHSGLTVSGTDRDCYFGHVDATGLVTGKEISVEVNYIPQMVADLVNAHMSQGAVLIKDDAGSAGVVKFRLDETA